MTSDEFFRCGHSGCTYKGLTERGFTIHITKTGHSAARASAPGSLHYENVENTASARISDEDTAMLRPSGLIEHTEYPQEPDRGSHGAASAAKRLRRSEDEDEDAALSNQEPRNASVKNVKLHPIISDHLQMAYSNSQCDEHETPQLAAAEGEFAQQLPSLQLTEAERILATVLLKMSNKDIDAVLSVVHEQQGEIRWKTAKAFKHHIDGRDPEGWEKETLRVTYQGKINEDYAVWIRQDLTGEAGALARMLLFCKAQLGDFQCQRPRNAEGERLFSEFNTGDLLQDLQACQIFNLTSVVAGIADRTFPGECAQVLPYLLYSDESCVQLGSYKFHPLLLFFAQPLARLRQSGNSIILAYLPVVGTECGLSGASLTEFRREVMHKAYSSALEELKDLSYRLESLPIGPDQRLVPFLCLPAAFIADQLEAWALLNIQPNAQFPDCNTLVHRENLRDPDAQHPKRTLRQTQEVVDLAQQLVAAGQPGKAKKALQTMSIGIAKMPALSGFNGIDPFQLCHPDSLHQTDLGDADRLVDDVLKNLPPSDKTLIDQHLLSIHHPGLRLPKGLLEKNKIRDLDVHTPQSIKMVADARIRYQHAACSTLHDAELTNCNTIKNYNNRKYEELIPKYGNIHILNSGYCEATHKASKAAYRHTNRQSDSVIDQITLHLKRQEVIFQEADEEIDVKARSAAELAKDTNCQVLTKSGKHYNLNALTSGAQADEAVKALLEVQPELHLLKPLLGSYCSQGHGEERLPVGSKVKLHTGVAVPFRKYRGAGLESVTLRAVATFGPQQRQAFSDVAVRSGVEGESWFCQLRALLSCTDPAGILLQLALVRWYQTEPCRQPEEQSLGMEKLVWEKIVSYKGNKRAQQPRYDIIPISSIERPVFLQPSPLEKNAWFYNHFV